MSHKEGWVRIYHSTNMVEITLLKGKLHESRIPAVEVNKKDSMYGVFGHIDLMVPQDHLEDALIVLEAFKEGAK
jgi:hypothetical protein